MSCQDGAPLAPWGHRSVDITQHHGHSIGQPVSPVWLATPRISFQTHCGGSIKMYYRRSHPSAVPTSGGTARSESSLKLQCLPCQTIFHVLTSVVILESINANRVKIFPLSLDPLTWQCQACQNIPTFPRSLTWQPPHASEIGIGCNA